MREKRSPLSFSFQFILLWKLWPRWKSTINIPVRQVVTWQWHGPQDGGFFSGSAKEDGGVTSFLTPDELLPWIPLQHSSLLIALQPLERDSLFQTTQKSSPAFCLSILLSLTLLAFFLSRILSILSLSVNPPHCHVSSRLNSKGWLCFLISSFCCS